MIDLGVCPIIVVDEESADEAGQWVDDAAHSRLNEYDRTEWWDMARKFMPGITEDEFEEMWVEYQKVKAERLAN